jgi:hypothetical protein
MVARSQSYSRPPVLARLTIYLARGLGRARSAACKHGFFYIYFALIFEK